MKEIKAIIQLFMLSKVVEALKETEGLPGVTVSDVRGFGRARAAGAPDSIVEGTVEYVKKSKLEVVVLDNLTDVVVQTIHAKAHTGNPRDGEIFVYNVEDVLRIRSGEHEDSVI
jgi:nitrogen regulatory protein P-II 1